MAIYDAVQAGRDDLALTLAVIVSAVSVAILLLSNRFLQRRTP
jgi:molybdate transport system permease protein